MITKAVCQPYRIRHRRSSGSSHRVGVDHNSGVLALSPSPPSFLRQLPQVGVDHNSGVLALSPSPTSLLRQLPQGVVDHNSGVLALSPSPPSFLRQLPSGRCRSRNLGETAGVTTAEKAIDRSSAKTSFERAPCGSRLAGECVESATSLLADTPYSPASRLTQGCVSPSRNQSAKRQVVPPLPSSNTTPMAVS